MVVVLIVAAGRITLRQAYWFVRSGISGYFIMLAAGLVLAMFVEWVAVYKLEHWAYAARMPTIPGLKVGLTSIAQMILLPPIIFRIGTAFSTRKS